MNQKHLKDMAKVQRRTSFKPMSAFKEKAPVDTVTVTIRMSEDDANYLKAKATEEGVTFNRAIARTLEDYVIWLRASGT